MHASHATHILAPRSRNRRSRSTAGGGWQLRSVCDMWRMLTLLDLSKNQLQELNEALFETTSLRVLYLQENELKIIPDSLQKLELLTRCSFAQNQLYELPHTITKLLNLTSFDVVSIVIVVCILSLIFNSQT